MFNPKTVLKILINTILGLVLVLIWAHFVNLADILKTISRVSLIGLLPVFLFMLLSPLIRALRLKIFLAEIKDIKLKDIIFLNGSALILNFFIPIRIGEIAKGVYLNTQYGLPLGKAVIWIFLDRFVDFLAVLLFVAVLLMTTATHLPSNFGLTVSFVCGVALVLTYLAVFQKHFSQEIVRFIKPFLIQKHLKLYFEKISTFILESFSVLKRHPKDLTKLILLTILAYGADASIWYFTFMALGSHQDFLKMYLGQLLSALTYLIPAAPGYVGSAEASGLLILSGIFGIGNNLASAMIVLFHMLSALFVIIFGLISIFSLKLDLGLIFRKALRK